MTQNLLRRLFSAKTLVRFAVSALGFSLTVGVANSAPATQGNANQNPDSYNYTRGGGG